MQRGRFIARSSRPVGIAFRSRKQINELGGELREPADVFVEARRFPAVPPFGDLPCDVLNRPVPGVIQTVHEPWLPSPTTCRGMSRAALSKGARDQAGPKLICTHLLFSK